MGGGQRLGVHHGAAPALRALLLLVELALLRQLLHDLRDCMISTLRADGDGRLLPRNAGGPVCKQLATQHARQMVDAESRR